MNLEIKMVGARFLVVDNEKAVTESFETRQGMLEYLKLHFEHQDYLEEREKYIAERKSKQEDQYQEDFDKYLERKRKNGNG